MSYEVIIGRNASDKKLFGTKGLAYIGKTYVKMGQYTSLSNKMYMDVSRSHVVLIAGKRGCLTEDTKVFTDKGYKNISEFNEKKDKILSYNKDKNIFEWEKAKLLEYPLEKEKLLQITLDDGRIIKLTKEHPLLSSYGKYRYYRKAYQLKEKDKLVTIKDTKEELSLFLSNVTHYPEKNLVCTKIKEIREIEGTNKVYDLTVDKNHSFIANGIISHNSGKSYTMGAIAEELSALPEEESQNISSLIFDTMGIYWTMKFRNDKDKNLLADWELKTRSLPVKVFVPFGYADLFSEKGIPVDEKFALDIAELEAEDWIITFNLDFINPVAVLIQRAMSFLREKKKKFTIKDIIKNLEADEKSDRETINAAVGLFEAAGNWGIFADEKNDPTKIKELITRGKTSVLDLSMYNSVGAFNIRALVISLLCRKVFKERMIARKQEEINAISKGLNYGSFTEKKQVPLVWLFIDEAHEFLPLEGKTIATDALTQILREGRQPGISLVLATQQPGQIHKDVMTQSDLVIAHRVTSEQDIHALNNIMQTYLTSAIQQYMNDLPGSKGSAIILDDNSERIYPVQIRPRFTWHGGDAPTAISFEEEI